MRLHSRRFEASLRRRVRQAIRHSPSLRRETRSQPREARQITLLSLTRPLLSLILAMLTWHVLEATSRPAAALAVATIWAAGFVFIQTHRLFRCLYASNDLPALMMLPIPETTIFRWQLQKFWRGSMGLLLDLVAAYAVVAVGSGGSFVAWMGVPLVALLAWTQLLALSILGAVFLPRFPYHLAQTTMILLGALLFIGRDLVGGALVDFLDQTAYLLNLVLPTGWPAVAFRAILPGGEWLELGLLLPIAGVLCTIRFTLARLSGTYQFGELIAPEAPDLVPGINPAESVYARINPIPHRRVGPTEIEDIIQERQFLAEPDWPRQGPMESRLWGRLSPRERALTELVFPMGLALSIPWKRVFRWLAGTCLVSLLVGWVSPTGKLAVLGVGLFLTSCMVMTLVHATGRAFQAMPGGGVNIPMYAGYPVGFHELSRLLFRTTWIQIPWVLLFGAGSGLAVCALVGWPLLAGAVAGLKAAGLLLASRFLLVTLAFSAGTNDTSQLGFRNAGYLLLLVAASIGFVGFGAASMLVSSPGIAWAMWALAGLDAWLFHHLYGWFYRAGRFDLLSLPKR